MCPNAGQAAPRIRATVVGKAYKGRFKTVIEKLSPPVVQDLGGRPIATLDATHNVQRSPRACRVNLDMPKSHLQVIGRHGPRLLMTLG